MKAVPASFVLTASARAGRVMRLAHVRSSSVLVSAALVFTQGVARAQESTPDMLRRIAPSVVRIKVGDDVGSGFVYPTPRHVTTSFSLVNRDGKLELVLPGNARLGARVVAWSEADDVAILELPRALDAVPLQLEAASGFAGQEVVLFGRPTLVDPDAVDAPVRRDVPAPRFGKVGLVGASQVNVDVGMWPGDDGAPIITATGRVLGVASGRRERRLGLIDAATAARIDVVRTQIGTQGAFDAHPPAAKGVFAGVYVSPWQAYHQVGAGVLTGYRYRWFAASVALTFSHASFTPLGADRMRARWSLAYEGYLTADWSYTKHRKLCLGAGVALSGSVFEERQDGRRVDLDGEDSGDADVGPLFVLQDVEGPVLFGIGYAPLAKAARLDIGLVFGR